MPAIAASAPRAAFAALLLAASPAAAALDAEKIQADAQAMLDRYVAQADGELQPQGKVTVTTDGDALVVTLPTLLVDTPGARIEVPGASLRLQETGTDEVAFTVTLPDKITGAQKPPSTDTLLITIGGQQIEGVYLPSLLTFARIDARLEKIVGTTDDGSFRLGGLSVKGTNAEMAPGKWHSEAVLALGQLAVAGSDNATLFSIGSIEQGWKLENFDLPAFAELQRRINGGNMFQPMAADDEAAMQAAQEMMQRLPELLAGASGGASLRLADLQAAVPGEPPFSLGGAAFDIGLAPDDIAYGLQLTLAVDKPGIDPAAAPVPPHLLPSRALADTGLRRLPIDTIWQALSGLMQQAMQLEMAGKMTPEAEEEIGQQMQMVPMMAMGMAAEAGSFAEIKSIELDLGPAKLRAHGVGPLMPGMPEPALRVEASIEGLEELAGEIEKLDPGLRDQAMPVLVMLRGLGKAESRDNKIVHTYLIEQNPQGAITVNGVSIDELEPKQQ